jgi:hypothetical protein
MLHAMTTRARKATDPLPREAAVALMAGAAADIEALAVRITKRVRKLEQGQAAPHLIEATRRAAVSLVEIGNALRRDGYFGDVRARR